jgi:hypothetical protein
LVLSVGSWRVLLTTLRCCRMLPDCFLKIWPAMPRDLPVLYPGRAVWLAPDLPNLSCCSRQPAMPAEQVSPEPALLPELAGQGCEDWSLPQTTR